MKLTDDEMRERARELHEREWVIDIDDDAQVIRPTELGECARIAAWIRLGPGDWSPADRERAVARAGQTQDGDSPT